MIRLSRRRLLPLALAAAMVPSLPVVGRPRYVEYGSDEWLLLEHYGRLDDAGKAAFLRFMKRMVAGMPPQEAAIRFYAEIDEPVPEHVRAFIG